MTMKRTEKANHNLELHIARQGSGKVAEEWAKPSERNPRIARDGHARMTATEYIRERMGRKAGSTTRRDVAVQRVKARRSGRP